jgi:integrase
MKDKCGEVYNRNLAEKSKLDELLKIELDALTGRNTFREGGAIVNSFYDLIDRFSADKIKSNKKKKNDSKTLGTLATYRVVKSRLEKFEKETRFPVNFGNLGERFFNKFTDWMAGEKFAPNTIQKTVKILKVFLKQAKKEGQLKDDYFLDFSYEGEKVDDVALDRNEIDRLYKYDFSRNTTLERVRDLFIFGCSTGLRISDFSNIQPHNIITVGGRKRIRIVTQKTKTTVEIPCDRYVLEIFKKYRANPNSLPETISDQKFNQYIKKAARAAGLTETSRKINDPEKELCDLISSRTCRKSLCTNLYKEGFPIAMLMQISGHASESSFLNYIRIRRSEAAETLEGFYAKRDAEKNGN